jgi:hypothetical protein
MGFVKDKIRESSALRQVEQAKWADLLVRAEAAGKAAGASVTPTPMVVVQRANPFDDNSAIVKQYAPVMDGACGFAWVSFRPAAGGEGRRFINWLKAAKHSVRVVEPCIEVRPDYPTGYSYWISDYNQSLTRKGAHADAFAHVINEAGIEGLTVYSQDRMD